MKNDNRNNRQVGCAVCLRRSGNMGYHYTDGTTVYVALADGIPTGFDDATYFAEVWNMEYYLINEMEVN